MKQIKHNGITFSFLSPCISELGIAAIFPILQKRKLRPKKAQFIHKDTARTKTQISSSQSSLSSHSDCFPQ